MGIDQDRENTAGKESGGCCEFAGPGDFHNDVRPAVSRLSGYLLDPGAIPASSPQNSLKTAIRV